MIKFDAIKKDAKKLQNDTNIHGIKSVYGTFDGAVNVYSTIKSYFDFTHCTESQAASFDAMHEWISTPVGLVITLSSSLFFMAFSNRANVYEKSEVGRTWKYLRESLQASRNAFKGIRGTILTTALFTTRDLRYLILPTALGFGGVYVLNRLLMVNVKSERDSKIKANEALFAHIMDYGLFLECNQTLTNDQLKQEKLTNIYVLLESENKEKKFIYIDIAGNQTSIKNHYILYKDPSFQNEQLYFVDHKGKAEIIPNANILAIREELSKNPTSLHLSLLQLNELLPANVARQHFEKLKKEEKEIHSKKSNYRQTYYLIKGFNGLIDGVYLYMGVLNIISLSPPALILGVILSTLYCLLCIASRLYEEYQTQQNLTISAYKVQLALSGKELELLLTHLNEIAIKLASETDATQVTILKNEQKKIDMQLEEQIKLFEKIRIDLKSKYKFSNLDIFLLGIKHALPFYGSLISAIFAVAFICFLFGLSLTPPVVLIGIALGIPIIIVGVIHAAFTQKSSLHIEHDEQKQTINLAKKIANVKACFKLTQAECEKTDVFTRRAYAKNAIISAIAQCLQADPLADTFYADGAEVLRSFWAGMLKGKKEIELLLNPFQQVDEQGHYQDAYFMYFFIIPAAILYAIVFSLKAFAKGFSRAPEIKNYDQHQVDKTALVANQTFSSPETATKPIVQTNISRPPEAEKQPDRKTLSPLTTVSLFFQKRQETSPNPSAYTTQDSNVCHCTS